MKMLMKLCIVVLLIPAWLQAETVQLTYKGESKRQVVSIKSDVRNVNGYSGFYDFWLDPGLPTQELYNGFCIELTQDEPHGEKTYTVVELSDLGRISPEEATVIQQLWGTWYQDALATTWMSEMENAEFPDSQATGYFDPTNVKTAAALQVALWEVIYEDEAAPANAEYDAFSASGDEYFRVTNEDIARGANWLIENRNTSMPVQALQHASNQDFAVLLPTGGLPDPIPLPPSMAMTLMGLVGIGGFGWVRRRRG